MRLLRLTSTALGLASFADAECNSYTQVSSWENQTFIAAGWKTPSSPLVCQEIWNDTKAMPLQSICEIYGIDRFSLQYWNCFLDSADGMSIPDVGYCVKAVTEPAVLLEPCPPFVQYASPLPFSQAMNQPRAQHKGDASNDSYPAPFKYDRTTPYNYPCSSREEGAEECHKTRECNTDKGFYPTCENGDCVCKKNFCSKSAECYGFEICRDDDQRTVCDRKTSLRESMDGICTCIPKIPNCASGNSTRAERNAECASQFNCTSVSWPINHFPTCVEDKDSDLGRSWCECKSLECVFENWWDSEARGDMVGDASVCQDIQCPAGEGEKVCAFNDWSSVNGTCVCKEYGPVRS